MQEILSEAAISDPMIADLQVFDLWLVGLEIEEAAEVIWEQREGLAKVPEKTKQRFQRCISDHVLNQYRVFEGLSSFFNDPHDSPLQMFQMDPLVLQSMVEKYYSLDDVFLRQIAGRRLAYKVAKDIPSISTKTGVRVHSCLRQFENLKRMFVALIEDEEEEEQLEKVHLVPLIMRHYLIPEDLSVKYSQMLFLSKHRFQAKKKKLMFLKQEDLEFFASVLMEYWTDGSGITIDDDFIETLKEFKPLILLNRITIEAFRVAFLAEIKEAKVMRQNEVNKVMSKLPNFMRSFCAVASKISKTSDFRDFFLLCYDEVFTFMFKINIGLKQWEAFFEGIKKSLERIRKPPRFDDDAWTELNQCWTQFVVTVSSISLQMLERISASSTTSRLRWFNTRLSVPARSLKTVTSNVF